MDIQYQENEKESKTPIQGVEITPEMRDAGAALMDEFYGVVDTAYLAEQVYIAMVQTLSGQPHRQDCSSNLER